MKWKEYTIKTTAPAEDLIVDALSELGIEGAEIRDKAPILKGDTFEIFKDVMPEQKEDDGLAEVVFYLDEDADSSVLESVKEALSELSEFTDIGEGTIEEGVTEDKDWVNNWKEFFNAFYVDDILIKPTWVEKPENDNSKIMVEIDPGTAFGTGSHETTKLCIKAIRKCLKQGDNVLDVGTGSGILGIIALKLGSGKVFGTDIDEMAVRTARENIELNGFSEESFTVVEGDIISDKKTQEMAGYGKYDLVVANILADIIIPLQREVTAHMKKGALLVVSGIINLKEEAVRRALSENPDLEILDCDYLGEWVSFTARKK